MLIFSFIKKIFTHSFILIIFLLFIGCMGFGSIVKYHYDNGEKFQFLQKYVMLIASVPLEVRLMIKHKSLNPYKVINKPPKLIKNIKKKRFEIFKPKPKPRKALLVLPRYDHSLGRAVVDIIDLKDFSVIHTFQHDNSELNNQVTNIKEFSRLKIDGSSDRFIYRNPLLLADGSLIPTLSHNAPLFKIDFCSNLIWMNDEEIFHHSLMLDHKNTIWAVGQMNPKSKYVEKYYVPKYNNQDFVDDSIINISNDGKILFKKSVTEILIENNIFTDMNTFTKTGTDPIHLNDIEPALYDSKYWKKGDLFLSSRHQSAIIHYRPEINKVINYLTGPFSQQHDVDIISDEEISIFDNNNSLFDNKYSKVVIYNFKTRKFRNIFYNELKENNFKTITQGVSHIFGDGSLMVDEQNHGRIILFNNKGEKEWEYVNKDKNGDIGLIGWSRVIENDVFINNFRILTANLKCQN